MKRNGKVNERAIKYQMRWNWKQKRGLYSRNSGLRLSPRSARNSVKRKSYSARNFWTQTFVYLKYLCLLASFIALKCHFLLLMWKNAHLDVDSFLNEQIFLSSVTSECGADLLQLLVGEGDKSLFLRRVDVVSCLHVCDIHPVKVLQTRDWAHFFHSVM